MRFKQYLSESKNRNLIGITIHDRLVTAETPKEKWFISFLCGDHILDSLVGAPKEVTGDFDCRDNRLVDLIGAPQKVGRNFDCRFNKITSLKGLPEYLCGDQSYLSDNEISSIEGGPCYVKGSLYLNDNKLTSLHNIHKTFTHIGGILLLDDNPIESHVLGVLMIPGVTSFGFLQNTTVQNIINSNLGEGNAGVWAAQQELIEAGLDDFAKL